MITNVPNPDELLTLAIRSYFVAWKEATSVFDHVEETGMLAFKRSDTKLIAIPNEEFALTKKDSEENLIAYEGIMQRKLQLIYSLIQHSQELALKSFICRKSPFLLLLGSDIKSWTGRSVDFRDLKTIDASDLLKVVNVICDINISESFQTIIEQVRRGRNAIQHLGKHRDQIRLLEPIDILTQQFIELFPGRNWLKDFLDAEGGGLNDFFVHSDFNSKTFVLMQLAQLHRLSTKRTAKAVLGIEHNSSIYKCTACIEEAQYDHGGENIASVERKRNSLIARCRLCEREIKLRSKKCRECGSDVVRANGEEDEGKCFKCGS